MKRIFLLSTIIILTLSVRAQVPSFPYSGNPSTGVGQNGPFGSKTGFLYTVSFADTTAVNNYQVSGSVVGFLKNIAGMRVRCVDDIWMRSNDLQRWIKQSPTAGGSGWSLTGNAGTDSTNFAGTTDPVPFILKAHSTEYQRLAHYTGTDTGYFGYVINSNYITDPSSFTTQVTANGGASSTAVAGGRQLTVAASDFSQTFNIPNVWPSSVLPKATYRAVSIKTASSNGLVLAQEVATVSIPYWARLWVEYSFSSRTATIKLQNGGGTATLATSSALAAISTGDSVACIFNWDYNQISATITNLNTSATTTVSTGFSPPNYAPTIYNHCTFFPLTSVPTVLQSLQVYIEAFRRPDFTFVGHSVIQGYAGVTRAQLVPEVIRSYMPDYKIQVDAMGSMRTADAMYWKDEIVKINGKYVPIMLGANDGGVTDAAFYAAYRALRDSIVSNGGIVIHFGQLPQNSFDFTARNDSLKTLYESLGDLFIDIFPLLKNGAGYGYLPYYDVGDGIHPSVAGDSLIASQFLIAVSPLIGLPINEDYVEFSKRIKFKKVASYDTEQYFNSFLDIPNKGYVDSVVLNKPLTIGDKITNSTVNSVLFAGTGGRLQQLVSGLSFDSTNARLGVGTSSPNYKFHVYENVNAPLGAYMENPNAGAFAESYFAVRNNSGAYGTIGVFGNGNPLFPDYVNISTNGAGMKVGTDVSSPLIFKTNALDRITVTSAGRVGVNVASPDSTFQIDGSIYTTGHVRFANLPIGIPASAKRLLISSNGTVYADTTSGGVSGSGTLNYVPKWTPNGTTLGNSLIYDNGTNLGVGTITPSEKIDVLGDIKLSGELSNVDTTTGSTGLLWTNRRPINYGTSYGARGVGMGFNSGYGLFAVNASGRPNVVGNLFMYNSDNGGGRINTSEASFRVGYETHYEMLGSKNYFEFHLPEVTTSAGTGYRPFSIYAGKDTTADSFLQSLIPAIEFFSGNSNTGSYFSAQGTKSSGAWSAKFNSPNSVSGVQFLGTGSGADTYMDALPTGQTFNMRNWNTFYFDGGNTANTLSWAKTNNLLAKVNVSGTMIKNRVGTTDSIMFEYTVGTKDYKAGLIANYGTGEIQHYAASGGYFNTFWHSNAQAFRTITGGIAGGSSADEDLTIQGTNHATKTTSYVNIQPTGGLVGIGTTTPTTKLHVAGRMASTQGADVASVAGAISLGTDGNSFEITGTNAITLISNTSWMNGAEVTLLFTSTATLTDGTANSGTDIGMELAGNVNFVASAGATIKLILSEIGGTQRWREVSRSVN